MALDLMSVFNERTNGAFSYIKLRSIDVDVRAKSVRINLIYPEQKREEITNSENEIMKTIITLLKTSKNNNIEAEVNVSLTMSHFDREFFVPQLLTLIKDYPAIEPNVYLENIIVEKVNENKYCVKLYLETDLSNYALERGVDKVVRKMLSVNYCEEVDFEIISTPAKETKSFIDEAEEEIKNYQYSSRDGHYIQPEDVTAFIGNAIIERAGYISDATREQMGAVYCGLVSDFSEHKRRAKEGESEGGVFYRFSLSDPTGTITCLYFPKRRMGKSSQKREQAESVLNTISGTEVVVKGTIKASTFKGNTTYDLFVNSISKCKLPKDIKIEHDKYRSAKEYKVVSPKRYIEIKQSTMFDKPQKTPKYLLGKTFCVFDVETTGKEARICKIIELAGVKIVDGVMTETFSTYVNPHETIPESITALTSITNEDVKNAPDVEDVLADFYKFSENTILVGHYVEFDLGFIRYHGRSKNILFDNESEDTMLWAQKYLKSVANYKLSTIVNYLGIKNEHAHRAIHDTIATAKAFIRLCEIAEQQTDN